MGEAMTTQIQNAQIYNTEKRCFEPGSLWFRDGKILDAPAIPNTVIDAEGGYVLPGLIDVHTHGRCGIDIMEADKTALSALSLAYAKSGVTTVFPTVMTAPLSKIEDAIQKIKAAEYTADFAGIHIEGPYISKKKPGCHDISAIRHPDKDEIFSLCERILPLFPHLTIAPEEDTDGGIRDFCACFGKRGGTVAIGHTDADFDTAMRALSDGASAFTHTFNAMTPLLHRAPGAAGAALYSDAYAEFICDGIHVHPAVIRIGRQIIIWIVPFWFTYVPIGLMSGSLRGMGNTLIPTIITAVGIIGLRSVWILLIPNLSLQSVFMVYPATWIVTSIVFLFYYYSGLYKKGIIQVSNAI